MRERPGVVVGRAATVIAAHPEPDYFTDLHRAFVGQAGRVHAVIASPPRGNPLVKVGFEDGKRIVFYRLSELAIDRDAPLSAPVKHGKRGSHLA